MLTQWALRIQQVLVGKDPIQTLKRLALAAMAGGVLFLTAKFVATPVRITGESMEPTCRNGQIKWVNRWAYSRGEPRRGDIVAIQGTNSGFVYLKRIIGLPGETIAITNGAVTINGVPLAEAYVIERERWNVPSIRLGSTQYLVIGDNRSMPQDFHTFGRVERRQIAGRIFSRL